jgi:hypothetical protein
MDGHMYVLPKREAMGLFQMSVSSWDGGETDWVGCWDCTGIRQQVQQQEHGLYGEHQDWRREDDESGVGRGHWKCEV